MHRASGELPVELNHHVLLERGPPDIEPIIEKKTKVGLQMSVDADPEEGLENGMEEGVEAEVEVPKKKKPSMSNSYAAKKTVAQGMMDVALITANANQMKFVIMYGDQSFSFYFVIFLISFSLILQVAVGVSLVFKARLDIGGKSKLERANDINNMVVIGVFLITIINVFIAAFSDSGTSSPRSAKQ